MSKPKVVLIARLNIEDFPFANVGIRRNAVKLPVEFNGKVYEPEAIQGFYARYPHIVGNCLFPGCAGKAKRHVQSLGKDAIDAYAQFQKIERDFERARQGKLPLEELKAKATDGDSIEQAVKNFEREQYAKQRKPKTIESYMGNLRHFLVYCAAVGLRRLGQVDRKACLGFVAWMTTNVPKRNGGHQNNTYRNKLKDLRVLLHVSGVEMPLKESDWPKEIRSKKEKYSTEAVKNLLAVANTVERHMNNQWTSEDDKDLIFFVFKTGFRDEEIQHAQYSDINFRNHTVNVTAKPKGSFPGHPELWWTPKDNEPREEDIAVDEAFLKRMKARQERYGAKSNDLIFPNGKGKPNAHLIRVIQRLAKEAGVEGRIGLHKFRKTFASMVAKKEGIEKARKLLGHSDIATTQRYLAADEMTPEQSRKMVQERYAEFGD
jgi:integrase